MKYRASEIQDTSLWVYDNIMPKAQHRETLFYSRLNRSFNSFIVVESLELIHNAQCHLKNED